MRRFGRGSWVPLVSLIAAACSGTVPSTSGRGDANGTPIDVERDARVLQMVDERRADTMLVDDALRSTNSATRARAALAIGQVKIRARYVVLRRLLVEVDTAVAANAAYALGMAKDTMGASALGRAVAGAPDVVAREAAWSLGEIGESARPILLVALGDGSTQPLSQSVAAQRSPAVRAALVMSTTKLRPVPLSTVTPWCADSADVVVRAAAYVIGRQRLAGGVRALLSVRAHRDEETRQHVARGLAKQAAGDSLAKPARDALTSLLADSSARVRANAARSVASFGPSAAGDVERALSDSDANVRVAASEALQTVFLRDSTAWARAWARDTTFRVRQQLLIAARVAGSPALGFAESAWARHPSWRLRASVLEARISDDKIERLNLAREWSTDSDARVRAIALGAVPANAGDAPARELAAFALADSGVSVRAAGLGILARRAQAVDIATAFDAFARAATDADDDARVAALRVIANAWSRDSARVDSALRNRLATFSASASPIERRIVFAVTPMSTWSRMQPSTVSRPISDYVRLVRTWYGAGATQPHAVIHTERGDITIELYGAQAPLVVEAFSRLASTGVYRNTTFHRVVPNFVAQDGDTRGDGGGGAGFTLRDAYSRRRHDRGAVGLATSGPDTGGSQYYLCHSAQPHLDGGYTVFGHVIAGFDVMDHLVQGDRMLSIEIK